MNTSNSLFTVIRYALIISIVINHGAILSSKETVALLDSGTCVSFFFIISGFWATHSYMRRGSALEFYRRRACRIFPTYWFAVMLCLFIGATFTSLPIDEFFRSSHTWKYLFANLSTINAACPTLPHVFENNPIHVMNGSLWFVKIVVGFYLILPLIVRKTSPFANMALLSAIYILAFAYQYVVENNLPQGYAWLSHQLPGVMMYFVAGIAAFRFFPQIMSHKALSFAFGLLLLVSEALLRNTFHDSGVSREVLYMAHPIALTLILFPIAYSSETLSRHLSWLPDYSYGLFLFHFPLCQIAVAKGFMPQCFWSSTIVVVLLSIILAAAFNACWSKLIHRRTTSD